MEGPRIPQDSELPQVIRFLDSNLRPGGDWSIAAEYPTALAENNRLNIRIIKESDKVLSHALIRPVIVNTPAGLFKVAGLGSVVTSSEHRNLGLSTQIIESCLSAATAQGCDIAILWTDIYDFYRRIGFELAGTELSALIDKEVSSGEAGLRFMDSSRIDPAAIHRLYAKHTVTSVRSVDETRKYLQIPNSRVYTAWDTSGTLRAYAIEGKGADLSGYVHEWGGGVRALISLFGHIRRTQGRPITVIIPGHSKNLANALAEREVKINHGFLGMIKLVNPESLFSKIKRHARSLGINDLVLEQEQSLEHEQAQAQGLGHEQEQRPEKRKFIIGVGDKIFATENERDLVRLLFGPNHSSLVHEFGPEVANKFDRIFPLPMWIWGWDSV